MNNRTENIIQKTDIYIQFKCCRLYKIILLDIKNYSPITKIIGE